MNPALSVIFFTTLSGAGYGLFMWLGLIFFLMALNALGGNPLASPEMTLVFALQLTIGILLTGIGLACSMFHLGQPQRAWRAFSQWRTSWLSREGVLSALTFAPALALLAALTFTYIHWAPKPHPEGMQMPWIGVVLGALSLSTVFCTAMIYASLKTVPAWRHWLVVPIYLLFAISTGFALLMTLPAIVGIAELFSVSSPWMLIYPIAPVATLTTLKLVYWRDIDRTALPSREAATALEGFGKVSTFERPHTEENYLTREMGFVLARKHSRKLRAISVLLFAGIPIVAWIAAYLLPVITTIALWIAALSALAGAFVERWLFFAEAKHVVTLYY
jgi:DMSO reductase anchor subunit